MSQPVFTHKLEEDWVQRVGTKLTLEVIVEESSEKVVYTILFFYFGITQNYFRSSLSGEDQLAPMLMMAELSSLSLDPEALLK